MIVKSGISPYIQSVSLHQRTFVLQLIACLFSELGLGIKHVLHQNIFFTFQALEKQNPKHHLLLPPISSLESLLLFFKTKDCTLHRCNQTHEIGLIFQSKPHTYMCVEQSLGQSLHDWDQEMWIFFVTGE